jgi:TolB protein
LDGNRIAYVRPGRGGADIWAANVNGGGRTWLTSAPGDDTQPAWSYDSSHLAFVSDRAGRPQVFVMEDDGGDQHQVAPQQADQSSPSWFGSWSWGRIVFVSDLDGTNDVWEVFPGNAPTSLHQTTFDEAQTDVSASLGLAFVRIKPDGESRIDMRTLPTTRAVTERPRSRIAGITPTAIPHGSLLPCGMLPSTHRRRRT